MRHILTACILFFSLSLAARESVHLPEIVNYYEQMNFLDRNKKDTLDPVMAAIERLEIMSKKSLISKSIYKMAIANLSAYMPISIDQIDSTAILLNQMLDNIAQTHTTRSSRYAQGLLWCAHICANKGDNKQAKALLNNGKKLLAQYGTGTFDGRDTLLEIFCQDVASQIEYNSGRSYQAVQISERACELKKACFGEKSEVYFNALLDLSNLYAERKQYRKANQYHNLGYNAYVERIKTEFCSTSESERTMFWEKAKTYINKTISIAHKMPTTAHIGGEQSLAAAAYNALLLSKGLLLNTSNSFENYIYHSGNAEALRILQQKKALATQHTPQQVLDSLDYAILDALRRNNQTFELPHLSIHWQDVAAKLGKKDLAIEFYRTEKDQYGAILLQKGWDSPKVIKLKKAALDSLHLEQYTKEQASQTWRISQAIWPDDIVRYFPVNGDGRIYFAADGILQITGIEYLPYCPPRKDGTYFCLSDLFPVYRLSSTRELVNLSPDKGNTEIAVYGGLKYDMNYAELKQDAKRYPSVQPALLAYAPSDQKRDARDVAYIKELDGALKEADSIVAIINNAPQRLFRAQAYTRAQGTETSFKALQHEHPRMIHVATHGFFLTQEEAEEKNLALTDNPMARSGLLLAGSEDAWFGIRQPDDVDDGILSALEISNMNFQGLDMVVLSACETGIGDIQADGVFGLQRGFKMAGTRSILMSLWKVDDDATCTLMTEFYHNWIDKKQSKHKAFELAKQHLRTQTDKGWNNPQFWAAFILLDGIEE